MFVFCKRQSLLGIGFTAVERLYEQGIVCPEPLRRKWLAITLLIEKGNTIANTLCKAVTENYGNDGFVCSVLKGQGHLQNYPHELGKRRMSGDIDLWCIPPKEGVPITVKNNGTGVEKVVYHGVKAVIEYVKMLHLSQETEIPHVPIYHHIAAPLIEGTEVEVHYRPSFCRSFLRNRRMQRWFSLHVDECTNNITQMGFAAPTPSVNMVYLMCHLFNHYFHEGIGLRQLMDYYYALKRWHDDCMAKGKYVGEEETPGMSREEVMHTLKSFGMGKFAAAVMWVLHEVFAMPIHYYICEPNEKEGQKLLAEIMQGGNFGQYDERGKKMKNGGTILHAIWKMKRVMRLVSSYPEEAICEPFFRVWHWGWRVFH